MSYYGPKYEKALPLIRRLPDDTWFSVEKNGTIQLQLNTQDALKLVRSALPRAVWTKEYDQGLKWWTYRTAIDGVAIRVYAVYEAPKTCTAIVAKRTVVKQVPATFNTVEVEEEYIAGWDCGADPEDGQPEEAAAAEQQS
jgi:hypothetical protein